MKGVLKVSGSKPLLVREGNRFPTKRVLKGERMPECPAGTAEEVSHEKGVESGEEGPGTNAVPHEKGVERKISTHR
jgi:hypothetical protein